MNTVEAFDTVIATANPDDALTEINELIEHPAFVAAMLKYTLRIQGTNTLLGAMASLHALVHLGILIGKEMSKDAKNYRN